MNVNPGSPTYWLVTLVLLVVLLGGNYLYVTFFLNRAEPAARAATETRLGIEIRHNIRGVWMVQPESMSTYEGNRPLLAIKVFAANLALLLVFLAGFALEILLIYLALTRLFRGGD